jgi:hypothetical protein
MHQHARNAWLTSTTLLLGLAVLRCGNGGDRPVAGEGGDAGGSSLGGSVLETGSGGDD